MGKRRQPSTIDRLPKEIREEIGHLRLQDGRTIDEILDHLRQLRVDVSRSALGRHCKTLDQVGEQMRRSREMATALVARFGAEPDDKLARLNLELMHGVVFTTLTAAAADVENGEGDGKVTFGPEEVMFLAKSLGELTRAAKTDSERILKLQAAAKAAAVKDAAAAVGAAAGEKGLSAETASFLMAKVLGVAA